MNRFRFDLFLLDLCTVGWLLAALPGFAAANDEHWDKQFGWPGVTNLVLGLGVNNGNLYAGGFYAPPGGVTNNQVDVWDGASWRVIPGLSGSLVAVYDFAFLGGDLYVGGIFSRAGGLPSTGLAHWTGSNWSDVGGFRG